MAVTGQEIDLEGNNPVTFSVNSDAHISAKVEWAKIGLHAGSCRVHLSALLSAMGCSHFVVFIHLHLLIVAQQDFPFYTIFRVSLYSSGKERAFTAQLVWPAKTWG